MGTLYPKALHKEAFQSWRRGHSYREVAAELDVDKNISHQTVRNWSKPDFTCNCGWHGWQALQAGIIQEAKQEMGFDDSKEALVKREKKRLQFLVNLEGGLTEILEAGKLDSPKTMEGAVDLLEKVYKQQRLIRGKSTSIAEVKGLKSPQISLTKIAKQLKLEGPEPLVEAVEEATIAEEN